MIKTLPLPHPDALAHSELLMSHIIQRINESGGIISFAEFMQQALYAPGLGYYSAGSHKLGVGGDFVTAPEITPLFAQCLARHCQSVLTTLANPIILELGAGSGKMAVDLLRALADVNCLPTQYLIIEVSADLRKRQQITLKTQLPEFYHKIRWLDHLPAQPFNGIILANEVLDAMPIQRFRLGNVIEEFYVSHQDRELIYKILPTKDAELCDFVEKLRPSLEINYVSEVNPQLSPWLCGLATIVTKGLLLLIDYGFPRREYYHPQRRQGTLMCHYQHHNHDNPLILIGLQDITAHVDFTAVAEAAMFNGWQVAGYTNQANFLLDCGLSDILSKSSVTDTQAHLRLAQQAKFLLLPSEMGELFKVLALTRDFDLPLLGFAQDKRASL